MNQIRVHLSIGLAITLFIILYYDYRWNKLNNNEWKWGKYFRNFSEALTSARNSIDLKTKSDKTAAESSIAKTTDGVVSATISNNNHTTKMMDVILKSFDFEKISEINSKQRTIDINASCPEPTILKGLCQKSWRMELPPRCVMSINVIGRLGNTMGQYAALYALSRWNGRPAFMLPEMANVLQKYFRVTMPALNRSEAKCLTSSWTHYNLHDWMDDSFRSINVPSQQPLMLTGYPCSWTYYDHLRGEIRREFRLHEHLETVAQKILRTMQGSRLSATFVGIHVRRSDYVGLMAGYYQGVVANRQFLSEAMTYFRSRYEDAIFVVVSDDMAWCRANIGPFVGDVSFAGAGNISDPILDMALMISCNHSIITIGTFGFWSAYLAGGKTVYMTNYTMPSSPFLQAVHYEDTYLPDWIPIGVNMSSTIERFMSSSTRKPQFSSTDLPLSTAKPQLNTKTEKKTSYTANNRATAVN